MNILLHARLYIIVSIQSAFSSREERKGKASQATGKLEKGGVVIVLISTLFCQRRNQEEELQNGM